MAATAAVEKTPKQTVLDVLGLMVGADLIRAMEMAFDTDDFLSLQSTLPALGSAGVRALHQPAFEAACVQGRADVAQVLLASESVNAAAAVTTLGVTRTLLQHAVHNDCPDVVHVLLTDASVEATINASLGEAEGWASWDIINAPLLLAVELGHVECVQTLLASAHVDIHAVGHDTDAEPVTPLGFAAQNGDLCCVRALLAADGIDVNCIGKDANGETTCSALMEAAYADHVPCLHTLLYADGVNINQATDDGITPLHAACWQNHTGVVRALLLGGGCRFKLTTNSYYLRQGTANDGTPLGMTTNANVRTLFDSGIDCWQRKHHAHHSWAMKQVVLTLLLAAQRMAVHAHITQPLALPSDAHTPVQHHPPSLPLLPEEMWLELLGFLRSADFSA